MKSIKSPEDSARRRAARVARLRIRTLGAAVFLSAGTAAAAAPPIAGSGNSRAAAVAQHQARSGNASNRQVDGLVARTSTTGGAKAQARAEATEVAAQRRASGVMISIGRQVLRIERLVTQPGHLGVQVTSYNGNFDRGSGQPQDTEEMLTGTGTTTTDGTFSFELDRVGPKVGEPIMVAASFSDDTSSRAVDMQFDPAYGNSGSPAYVVSEQGTTSVLDSPARLEYGEALAGRIMGDIISNLNHETP
jgi:hypothetical protein